MRKMPNRRRRVNVFLPLRYPNGMRAHIVAIHALLVYVQNNAKKVRIRDRAKRNFLGIVFTERKKANMIGIVMASWPEKVIYDRKPEIRTGAVKSLFTCFKKLIGLARRKVSISQKCCKIPYDAANVTYRASRTESLLN
jgi:hypothetical protein